MSEDRHNPVAYDPAIRDSMQSGRRRFVTTMAALGAWVLGSKGTANMDKRTATAPPRTPCEQADANLAVKPRLLLPSEFARFATYPLPSYVPEGYRNQRYFAGPQGGFGRGPEELMLTYSSPDHRRSSLPLRIFVCPGPNLTLPALAAAPCELFHIRSSGGEVLLARYFDGMWAYNPDGEWTAPNGIRYSWTQGYLHLVSASAPDFSMAVIAPVPVNGGLPRSEITRVLTSMTIRTKVA
jgi:hypothetical protein